MRIQTIAPFCCIAALGIASSACSLLGTYASSASSMMAQPGATAGATPATAGAPASTPEASGPADGSNDKSEAKTSTAPSTVSVTLRNGCSKTVKVFFGDKPKFGSGRYSSLSSNSRTNQTFKSGDQLWIVDDEQNGVDNVRVEPGMKEIEVDSSCDGFRAH